MAAACPVVGETAGDGHHFVVSLSSWPIPFYGGPAAFSPLMWRNEEGGHAWLSGACNVICCIVVTHAVQADGWYQL